MKWACSLTWSRDRLWSVSLFWCTKVISCGFHQSWYQPQQHPELQLNWLTLYTVSVVAIPWSGVTSSQQWLGFFKKNLVWSMGRALLSFQIGCSLNDVCAWHGIVSCKPVIQNKLHNWFKNVDFPKWILKTAVKSTCDLHHVCPSSWLSNSKWTDFHEVSFLELYWNLSVCFDFG